MEAEHRHHRIPAVSGQRFDVVIVGGGISGASIFARLASDGYRTLLIDRGDFGSATSQESAMMIWGGLLYLTRFDFRTVYQLSRSRDQLLEHFPDVIRSQYFRYLPLKSGWQARPLVKGLVDFYRLLGGMRRRPNFIEDQFDEAGLVQMARYRGSVAYEEAMLTTSDARFVLDLIRRHDAPEAIPLNYVGLEVGDYDPGRRVWQLALKDRFAGGEFEVQARLVINAAGTQVDRLNQQFSIVSPYRHVFSKGVMLSFARPPGHDAPLIFELGKHNDVLTFFPWGPVSCWGPTEIAVPEPAGAGEPNGHEVRFLLEQVNGALNHPLSAREIVSFRSGVRPLAVPARYHAERYPLELSRHHLIHVAANRRWLAVYGGKFTSAITMAERIGARVAAVLGRPAARPAVPAAASAPPLTAEYPGLAERFPAIAHCVEHEYCLTIGDYLRRRTNIAQWVPRNGLGRSHEHLAFVRQLATALPRAAVEQPENSLEHYVADTDRIFDRLYADGEDAGR